MPQVHPTSIRIPRDLKKRLVACARKEKRAVSNQIIYIIEQYCRWSENHNAKGVGSAAADPPAAG